MRQTHNVLDDIERINFQAASVTRNHSDKAGVAGIVRADAEAVTVIACNKKPASHSIGIIRYSIRKAANRRGV